MFQRLGLKVLDKYVQVGASLEGVSEGDRLNMRMMMLEDMKTQGFDKYKELLNKYVGSITDSIRDNRILESDDPPFKPDNEEPFWEEAIPQMKEYLTSWKPGYSATAFLSSGIIKIGIDAIVGNSPTMTLQQKIMFKALLGTYFSDDIKMFPVSVNMDSVLYADVIDEKFSKFRLNPKMRKRKLNIKNLFMAALSGAGPFMLKILQSLATNNSQKVGDVKVTELTEKVFSDVPPMTDVETKFVLENLDIPQDEFKIGPRLGSASIAQAHFADYQKDPESKIRKYVLKIIKPMYAFYFLCELDFLFSKTWKQIGVECRRAVDKEFGGAPERYKILVRQCRQLLMFFAKEFAKEFDYKNEFVETIKGRMVYQKRIAREFFELGGSKVAAAISYAESPFPFLMLQRVPGRTIDWMLNNPTQVPKEQWLDIYAALYRLMKRWFEAALLDEPSFFHADAHPGNIMWDGQDLVLIDFGSTGSLSVREQCAMIKAMLYSNRLIWVNPKRRDKQAEKIRESNRYWTARVIVSIWKVCNVPPIPDVQAEVDSIIDKILNYERHYYAGYKNESQQRIEFGYMFVDIVKYSRDIGTCVSSSILLYGRAISYLANSVDRVFLQCSKTGGTCEPISVGNFIGLLLIANLRKVVGTCKLGRRLKETIRPKDSDMTTDIMKSQRELMKIMGYPSDVLARSATAKEGRAEN